MTARSIQESGAAETPHVTNDFSITVATVNGSGSQTSNLTILRSLFKMGIPVSGKNLFPSNIQGLPTWYTIRVSKDGFLARREEQEIVIAMNPATFTKDLANVVPGGAFYYADDIKLPANRSDVAIYPMPIKQLARQSDAPSNLRDYISNMVYVGILAQMIGIDLETIKDALNFHFRGKQKPIDMNYSMIQVSYDWAAANLKKNDPYIVAPLDLTRDYIMADGNTAGALGSIYGGVQFAAWYPITPASSLAEALNAWLPQLRKDPQEPGKHNFAVVQAEDELAAIGMATGAGWAGLRAMTVVWNVQRVGPSTGLPTRTAQGDLSFTYFMGHGDTNFVILLPGSVNECFEFGWRAFDIAEHIQSPVFVLSDLDFGMNQWMTKPFQYPDQPMDRGKILWEEDLEKLQGNWGRYRDVDGDGIPYRTVPGNCHPSAAYFTRGTGHDEDARYTEDAGNWQRLLARLKTKYLAARTIVPRPVLETMEGAEIGIIAFGSTESAIQEARAHLLKSGIPTDFMRIRAIPFTEEVGDFMVSHRVNYVFEMNRDGQLNQLLTLEHPERCHNVISIAYTDGLPPTARQVREAILTEEAKLA